uniref:SANTA domain-containing protein n=1 Tax=Caenorhabditis japonica TaxID=281687 RepID=A0A8R1I7X3_CAEJA
MAETGVLPLCVQNVMDMEIVRLNLWSIKFYAESIKLEGFVRNSDGNMMQKVCSEAICKRMTSVLLFDVSGRFFELVGQIDHEFQVKNGMPSRIVAEFMNGFPENWLFLIKQCLPPTDEQIPQRQIQIQSAPAPPKEPIVTLADESEHVSDHPKKIVENGRIRDEESADCTFRVPHPVAIDAITPIRFTRGVRKENAQRIFDSSTPKPQVEKQKKPLAAFDADLFAAPAPARAPPPTRAPPPNPPGPSSEFVLLDEMDELFNNAEFDKTPGRTVAQPRRINETSRMDRKTSRTYSEDCDRKYDDRRVECYSRSARENVEPNRNEFRMNRKRPSVNNYADEMNGGYNYRSNKYGRREVFESNGYHSDEFRSREAPSSRSYADRDYYSRKSYHRGEEQRNEKMYGDILRREMALETRLKNGRSQRHVSESSEDSMDDSYMVDEWDRENQRILDSSIVSSFGRFETSPKKSRIYVKKERTAKKARPKPVPPRRKKNSPDSPEMDDLNDSIASNRPRRACVVPSTPVPKRVTWPKRDLDRLSRVIELKKPSSSDSDWTEVARLLAKEGVEGADAMKIAMAKLKWKEPVKDCETVQEDLEMVDKKRKRGFAAKVKESVQMMEEMRDGGEQSGEMGGQGVEQAEDYQPADLSADESLLALATPCAGKKKGGTRRSVMPAPVEDSPVIKLNECSYANSPKLDVTKCKEVETTLRYVHHLSTVQARPGSSSSRSYKNRSVCLGKSLSLEQGARKAQKLISMAVGIEEEDEEEEDDDDAELSIF